MKQFFTILKFECQSYLKNKIFIVMTLLFVVVIAGVLTIPALFGNEGGGAVEPQKFLLANRAQADSADDTMAYFSNLPDFQFTWTTESDEVIKQQVFSGEVDGAVVLTGTLTYDYYVRNRNMYDANQTIFNNLVVMKYRMDILSNTELTEAEKAQLVAADNLVESNLIADNDQEQSFWYTYILIFALYMVVLLYGQMVAQSVASEKSSRAMEILITSAKPNHLMFGKVISAGLCGLLQLVLILGTAFLFYHINIGYWGGNALIQSIFGIPLQILLYMLLFFLLGYFIYAFVFAALGSLAGKAEDVGTLVLPATYLMIFALIVVMSAMASGTVDSPLMVFCSYFPFTSPMAMFTRICMGQVPIWGVCISIALLVGTTVGLGYLSSVIYRMGVLMYGKPPKMKELFKLLKEQRRQKKGEEKSK